MRLYMVYDWKAESTIGSVIQSPNDETAARLFYDAVGSEDLLKRHPEDFSLVWIGTLDVGAAFVVDDMEATAAVKQRVVAHGTDTVMPV